VSYSTIGIRIRFLVCAGCVSKGGNGRNRVEGESTELRLSLILFSRRWLCHETTTVPKARKRGGGGDIRNRYIEE